MIESTRAWGKFQAECRRADGTLRWRRRFRNLVTTVGKNLALDTFLSGSSYTVTGPYLGLISGTSFTGVSIADTMSSHGGWLEAGATNDPKYSGIRPTCVWDPAALGTKELSLNLSYVITSDGNVVGGFVVFGSGASPAVDSSSGVLYSAGAFTGGPLPVFIGDVLSVAYATGM